MIGQNAPTDPVNEYAQLIARQEARISELERLAVGRPPSALSGFTAASGWTTTVTAYRVGASLYLSGTIQRTGADVTATGVNQTVGTLTNAAALGNGPTRGLTIWEVSGGATFRAGFSYTPSTGVIALTATTDTIPTSAVHFVSGSILLDVA